MEKALRLNLLPLTHTKEEALHETYMAFREIASASLRLITSDDSIRTYNALHGAVYTVNKNSGIASQLIEEAQRYAWQRRKVAEMIQQPTVRFDKRRNILSAKKAGNPRAATFWTASERLLSWSYVRL